MHLVGRMRFNNFAQSKTPLQATGYQACMAIFLIARGNKAGRPL